MSDAALVSCIIPVFNGEQFVAEAIDSVLAQTHRPIEVLVVNDGSTDGTVRILEDFGERITVIQQNNSGQVAARNHGLKVAKGEFIAFQDADDLWMPNKLEIQMRNLEAHPDVDLCTCLMENFWVSELAAEAERFKNTDLSRPYPATWQGILARRRVFDQVGEIDTSTQYSDVREWLHRARGMGIEVEHIDRVLVRRRIHTNNLSRRRKKGELDRDLLLRMAERAVIRRRSERPRDI